jgi:hypothetical protein
MAIVLILLWPMTMDRRQRWRNKRAARKFEAAEREGNGAAKRLALIWAYFANQSTRNAPGSWLAEYLQSAYRREFAARVTAITQTANPGEARRPGR